MTSDIIVGAILAVGLTYVILLAGEVFFPVIVSWREANKEIAKVFGLFIAVWIICYLTVGN